MNFKDINEKWDRLEQTLKLLAATNNDQSQKFYEERLRAIKEKREGITRKLNSD